ncbi:MAG: 50S ribosomal protein L6 [Candidatus Wildermuthbacteria bacterium]|nr:50S ribosomal protein L6 [Candidatus Wildermuthbacteria bacterium]
MSRIGKKPIEIPAGVDIAVEGDILKVKGPKGAIDFRIHPLVEVTKHDSEIVVVPRRKEQNQETLPKEVRALWGTTRAVVANMVKGVTVGYEKKLEIQGVGFRAQVEGDVLVLHVGYSHLVKIKAPDGIQFSVNENIITVSGINKEQVGEYAARIRAARKVEPYKGKGIRYQGEIVKKKAGKKVAAAGATGA